MSEFSIHDDLKRLEDRLRTWAPARPGMDRDRMLYEAGRLSVAIDPRRVVWPLATAASILLAVSLAWGWSGERFMRQSAERSLTEVRSQSSGVIVAVPVLPESVPDPSSYWTLSRRLIASADSLPTPEPADGAAAFSSSTPGPDLTPADLRRFEAFLEL